MEIWKESAQQDKLPTGKFGRKGRSGIPGSTLGDTEFVTEVSCVWKGEPALLYKSAPWWVVGQRTLAVSAVAAACSFKLLRGKQDISERRDREKGGNRRDTLQGGKLGVGTFFNSFVTVNKIKMITENNGMTLWLNFIPRHYIISNASMFVTVTLFFFGIDWTSEFLECKLNPYPSAKHYVQVIQRAEYIFLLKKKMIIWFHFSQWCK